MKRQNSTETVCGYSLDQVTGFLGRCQTKMQLEEWVITCVLSSARKMSGKVAKIDYDRTYSNATMYLATDLESEQELFASIFHELLHLHFWWVSRKNRIKWELMETAFMRLDKFLAEQYLEIRNLKRQHGK